MGRKRKSSEEIKKNYRAKRKKTALWDTLDLAILAKIFDLLPSYELFWNVSLVCRAWQLACWDKLFWKNDGFLDLTAAAPFQCCRNDDDKSSSSNMPKEYHNHTCSNLMMQQLQTVLFGTHDAYGNSLKNWRSSIKTIRIPFGIEICDDILWSLSYPELVVAKLVAEPNKPSKPLVLSYVPKPTRPLLLCELSSDAVFSWNLKRLLLKSQLFRKPIFTHCVDVDEAKVFEYILRSTFDAPSIENWKAFYPSRPASVKERCRRISQDLKDMIEKLTNCGILPKVLTEAEHRLIFQDPRKDKKFHETSLFSHFDDETQKLACQQNSRRQISEFWSAVEDLFSDDKKYISMTWKSPEGKSVFLDHFHALNGPREYAEREWHSHLVRQGIAVEKSTQKWTENFQIFIRRKRFLSYSRYQEMAKYRRKFFEKLMKIQLSPVTPIYRRACVLAQDGMSLEYYKENEKKEMHWAEGDHLLECLKLLELWGGGPYKYVEAEGFYPRYMWSL